LAFEIDLAALLEEPFGNAGQTFGER